MHKLQISSGHWVKKVDAAKSASKLLTGMLKLRIMTTVITYTFMYEVQVNFLVPRFSNILFPSRNI